MKKFIISILSLIVFLAVKTECFSLEVYGDVELEIKTAVNDGEFLFDNGNLKLSLDHEISENAFGLAEIGLRYHNHPESSDSENPLLNTSDLSLLTGVQPIEIYFNEIFFSYYGFIFDDLDITIGKQRIAWGTATALNPTDVLNPVDLIDPFDFTRRIPTLGMNMQYYLPFLDSSIQLVYEPYSQVARLNNIVFEQMDGYMDTYFIDEMKAQLTEFTDNSGGWGAVEILTPEANFTNGLFGVKYAMYVGGFDISVNAVRRINDFPTVTEIYADENLSVNMDVIADVSLDITEVDSVPVTNSVTTNSVSTIIGSSEGILNSRSYALGYGKEWEFGLDFARDMNIFLLWGEVGVFFPEAMKVKSFIDTDVYTYADVAAYSEEHVTSTSAPYVVTNYTTNYVTNNLVVETNTSQVIVSTDNNLTSAVYIKYTVGLERFFSGGWYLNFQYNHGQFNERGNSGLNRLQDYFVLYVEKSINDKIKLSLAGTANIDNIASSFEADDPALYLEENSAVMGILEANYMPASAINFAVGAAMIAGTGGSVGLLTDHDYVYGSVKYNF